MYLDDLLPPVEPAQPAPSEEISLIPQRIAMITVHTSPLAALGGRDTGGMNVYIKQICEQFAQANVRVDVFTRKDDASIPLIQEPMPGFRVVNLEVGPSEPVSREELHSLLPCFCAAVVAFQSAHKVQYDVIHSHYWLSGLAAERLAAKWGVPWVHMSHTLGRLKEEHRLGTQQRESNLRLRSERHVLDCTDATIASNLVERTEILDFYGLDPSKVYVAPCGVDTTKFHPADRDGARARLGLDPKQKLVLYVGRIEPLKGLDTLLEAAAILKCKGEIFRILVVGGTRNEGDTETACEMSRLRSIAADLSVEDVVEFCGPSPQSDLPDFYRAADVCVVPSHYESFGMAALEAMACGTPVVASKVGGLKSSVRDNRTGFLVAVNSSKAFADRIRRILNDKELHARLSANAARTARRYSWQKVAESNLDVYRRAIASARVPVDHSLTA